MTIPVYGHAPLRMIRKAKTTELSAVAEYALEQGRESNFPKFSLVIMVPDNTEKSGFSWVRLPLNWTDAQGRSFRWDGSHLSPSIDELIIAPERWSGYVRHGFLIEETFDEEMS